MYTVAQVAEMLSLHPKTVHRFIHEGRMQANKVGREWRVRKDDLREFAHGELSPLPAERQSSVDLGGRIRISAVIELVEGNSIEVSRISNSLLAVLNSHDQSQGAARYDLVFNPEDGKARFVLYGDPRFIRTTIELVEMLIQPSDNLDERPL